MPSIGLTGGIGSGKSTVAAGLAELGAVVIDADALAREVVRPGTAGLTAVIARFGAELLTPDGTLDRPALGQLVFADGQALADLNAIVHPLVAKRTAELTAAAGAGSVVVYDVPLLVENNLAAGFEAVIVVEAPLPVRLSRLADRGMDADTARARIARQATDEQRRTVATEVIDNSGSLAQLHAQVERVWRRLIGE
ncbi:MAG: dephospho-CoA kinase [Jatrophihabitans sp.]